MAPRYVPGASVAGTVSTADDSLTLTEQVMISGSSVKAIHCVLSGTNMIVTNVTKITVRAGGPPLIDVTPAQLRAWLGFVGKKAEITTGGVRFTIPFHGFMGLAAPAGKLLRLTASKNATPSSANLAVHYLIDEQAPSAGYFSFLSTGTGLAAGANSTVSVPIPEGGLIKGVTIPDVANITMLRLWHPQYGSPMEFSSFAALQEAQELARGTTVADPIYFELPFAVPAVTGARWEFSTGAGWSAGNEMAYLKLYANS